jgi:hypothetical protein
LIGARCLAGGVQPSDLSAARHAMQTTANPGVLFTSWFDRTLPTVAARQCPGLSLTDLDALIDAGLANPKLAAAGPQQDLLALRARIALAQNNPKAALADFTRALDLQVRPGMALQSAAELGSAGYPSLALELLDHYELVKGRAMPPAFGMPMIHEWVLARQNYWPNEVAHLRRQLRIDAGMTNANTNGAKPIQAAPNDPAGLQ